MPPVPAKLEFRRKFFKLFGAEIAVKNFETTELWGVIRLKAWRLREDIRLYADYETNQTWLRLHARQIIDFGATYDAFEGEAAEPRYAFRRKGLRSTFVRDHWTVTDSAEQRVAEVQETSGALALSRRYLGIIPLIGEVLDLALAFAPQTYQITAADGSVLARIVHRKNPLVVKMELDSSMAPASYNPLIGVAMAALLSTIDATKN
jgi:hypothetical protein